MTKKILIDFEKIKDPYSGLGQFCAHLKSFFDKSSLDIRYWIPGKFQKLAKKIPMLMPSSDVFHAVHQDSPYWPLSQKTKYVLTIHDLNALHEQTQFGSGDFYKKNLQRKIDRASVITFISKFTQSEVEKNFRLEEKKCQVIYNGISLGSVSERPSLVPAGPFLFSVGTVLPKKNFHVLIDFLKLVPEYQMVLAGTTFHSYAKEMQKRIEDEGLADRFFLVGTINEAQKLWYYQNASAFIFPSLLEGFGLPVAEAMSLGLPLFISDKTSLPEIGGADAYYFKNFEATHMLDVFTAGMKDFSLDKKSRLIERSKMFDWKTAAENYLDIYTRL
ncbi:MAG: glycosyltransferase family 4 protein [Bacteriovorax sp.]